MLSLMEICANEIVKHKLLLDYVLTLDKIHTDVFECLKNAMKTKRSCNNLYRKHFSHSFRLPYTIVLGSSPPE